MAAHTTKDDFEKHAFRPVARAKQAARDGKIPAEWLIPKEYLESKLAPAAAAAGASIPSLDHLGKCLPLEPGKTVPALDVRHVPAECGVLTPQEIKIVETDATALVEQLHGRQLTCVQVTTAFCKAAAVAHQLTNCLSEIFFDEALQRAKELDNHHASQGSPFGPLAGLPISIKDNFKIKGHDSTLGFVCWANEPQEEDSTLISILRNAGAVLYCKTNVPTAMMIAETLNNVFGRTLNPHNLATTCGGSSGGEGALIAMKGSPLGVGTDIGGSIRIPSSLCGLYGLKPSLGRFPTHNARSGMAGQESVHSINGPMANSLRDLSLFGSAVVSAEPWLHDPKCVPIPWRAVSESQVPAKGLVFGLLRHDGMVHPTPPVARALDEITDVLRKAGHEVIEWKVEDNEFMEGMTILDKFFFAEGREGILELLEKGGEVEAWIPGFGRPRPPLTVRETWEYQARRTTWAGKLWQHWSRMRGSSGRQMDALIAPATPYAGVAHDQFAWVGYTGVWNLADKPGVTIPVTKADAAKDAVKSKEEPLNEFDQRVKETYDAKLVHGSPVVLQLVGRRLHEEELLAVAHRVDDALKASRR